MLVETKETLSFISWEGSHSGLSGKYEKKTPSLYSSEIDWISSFSTSLKRGSVGVLFVDM